MSEIGHEQHKGAGARLRAARRTAGLSLEDVASRLKMPVRVVKSLEEEDWSRLGAPVFVRGQLRSYSKLLGLPIDPVVEAAGVAPVEPPKLTPRTYISPLQRFAEQAARRTIYIVMTAAIAIPVWLTAQSHLDVASVAQDAAPLDVPVAPGATDPAPDGPALVDEGPRPVVASLASLPARKAPATATRQGLSLRFSGDSWIEISDREGRSLEQVLVHAGDERHYDAGTVGSVVLGNASVVDVRLQGRSADLSPFMRANVARFTVSSDGSLAPAAD
ncbi:MAG TPA: RodZ domain-containing protein [Luteimonas sp.]|jgi:cytoskeleton protein RodZ|nr:RodZ domain-containing protein [Luteimonas sp.]